MTTTVRHKRSSRSNIGPYKRHELLFGEIFYPVMMETYTGYADGKGTKLADFISAEMKTDWEQNREELLGFWKSGAYTTPDIFPDSKPWLFQRRRPGTLPWAAKMFEQKENQGESDRSEEGGISPSSH
jgi:hypothetical protein